MIERTDAGIQVDIRGLLSASERRGRRWRAAFQWGLVGTALLLLAMGWWWERGADLEKRRVIEVLKFTLATTQARANCWQAIALHVPGYGPTIPLAQREAAVNKCVETELARWVATKNGRR